MEKYLSKDGLEYLIEGLDPRYAKERDLADVAKSGSYDDLIDKPSIPSTPGDIDAMPASTTLADLGGIALTEKGANSGVAPLNAGGKIDSQYLPSYVDDVIECYVVDGYEAFSANWLSKTDGGNPLLPEGDKIYVVLSSGDYLNKVYRWGGTAYVSIGGDIDLSAYATQTWVQNQGYLTSHQDISGKVDSSSLASVATSGDYTDLTNKPTIPTIPTNVSSFINDAGYLTSHQDISGKANSADLATVASSGDYTDLINKPTIPSIPSNVSAFINDAGYLTQHQSLSGYATETWVGNQGFLTSHQDISGKVDSSSLATVATSGDYDDLINKPTIPTVVDTIKAGNGTSSEIFNKDDLNIVLAGGNYSHAEGYYTTAGGNQSHAEGYLTTITGNANVAHVEGYQTMAASGYQHVQGKLNVSDYNGRFADIVGNGKTVNGDPVHSNASALDWNGNLYLAGDVYVGCDDYTTTNNGTVNNGLTTAGAGGTKLSTFSGSYNDLTNKPTLFSGSYNDLTDKPTIPAAYTLPTASTSTLGGVKVDGSTITITDGIIEANIPEYTAGANINIDPYNVIDLPDNLSFTYEDQEHNIQYVSSISPESYVITETNDNDNIIEMSLTSGGVGVAYIVEEDEYYESCLGYADAFFTKMVWDSEENEGEGDWVDDQRVTVDYEGVKFSFRDSASGDWLEDLALFPELDGNGDPVLTFDGNQIAYLSDISSEQGATYTAGDGIDISNGVISINTLNGGLDFDRDGAIRVSGQDYTMTFSETNSSAEVIINNAGITVSNDDGDFVIEEGEGLKYSYTDSSDDSLHSIIMSPMDGTIYEVYDVNDDLVSALNIVSDSITFDDGTDLVELTMASGGILECNGDQVVLSSDLATVATSGSYNDLDDLPTIPSAYSLPTASTSTLGGVKVDGSTVTIDANGVISASGGGSYTLPAASSSILGGVTVDNSTIQANGSGQISTKLPAPPNSDGYYLLKRATSGINQTVTFTWESVSTGGSY